MTPQPFSFSALAAPCIMGILNITPDSFSDCGDFYATKDAIAHGNDMAQSGAALLDLGAEASSFFRKGIIPINPEEQLRRLTGILPALARLPSTHLSIDTRSALVARGVLQAGATIINDISAGTHDPAMLSTVAADNASLILMHMGPAFPATPTADDEDILLTVRRALKDRLTAALAAGIPRDRLAIDPGVGFGKTMHDNWTLALHGHELADLRVPVVLGASRKRFLETPPPLEILPTWNELCNILTARSIDNLHPRDIASAALTTLAARRGVAIHRVHHVTLAMHALRL